MNSRNDSARTMNPRPSIGRRTYRSAAHVTRRDDNRRKCTARHDATRDDYTVLPRRGGNSERTLSTHPRALVIAGAGAPASIFLVLSPIIQPKPPNSRTPTHTGGPTRWYSPARSQCQKRDGLGRSISRHLHAHTTPKPALTTRRFATPPTHRTSATDSS